MYVCMYVCMYCGAQRAQLEAVASLLRDPWLAAALPTNATYWLGTGPASLLALHDAAAPGTPLPADAFYVYFDVWLLGLGAPAAPDLWCYDNATLLAADCFDRRAPARSRTRAQARAHVQEQVSGHCWLLSALTGREGGGLGGEGGKAREIGRETEGEAEVLCVSRVYIHFTYTLYNG